MTGAGDPLDPGEVPFEFQELFFSRTDPAGIILFGNSVFQRISHYPWHELLNKPHKIVRHPDTPRAVFWLLWDTLKQGRPIGAFVKNRAKDGRPYWVFAIVTPIEGGYLSVRLRPSGPLFDVVRGYYPELAARERREGLKPQDSAAILAGTLAELGFADYPSFMAEALAGELAARDRHLERDPDPALKLFADLLEKAKALLGHAQEIAVAYARNEHVPFNFRVLAAQLGQEGAAIAVISNNYAVLSHEMQAILDQFTESARSVFNAINRGLFLICTARIQRELLSCFKSEPEQEGMPRDTEIVLLTRQQEEYSALAYESLKAIAQSARGFGHACLEMSRLATGLEVMRVMGKVECARHDTQRDRMDELLRDLEGFQRTVSGALKAIEQVNRSIQRDSETLLARAA
ncbi:MAG: PAS domain-containing protein [Hyphomonadaceae bacterium]|nr:PAS domain-containing protein [Hyphomonadaceae bacterium]